MSVIYSNNFSSLADFTTVATDPPNMILTAESNAAKHDRTAGAGSSFNTFGLYSTVEMGDFEMTDGSYVEVTFNISNISTRDMFVLLKDSTGIDYNAGTIRAGIYAEGSGGATNFRCWDNSTNRGSAYSVSASTDYKLKMLVNGDGTLSCYARLSSGVDADYVLVGTTVTVTGMLGTKFRFATNLFTADTIAYVSSLQLNDGLPDVVNNDHGGDMLVLGDL